MSNYKGIYYWHNALRGKWIAQIGYEVIAEAQTIGGINRVNEKTGAIAMLIKFNVIR